MELTMANKTVVVFLFDTTQLDNFCSPAPLQHSGIFQRNSRHNWLHLGCSWIPVFPQDMLHRIGLLGLRRCH